MSKFVIYYGNKTTYTGSNKNDWINAPDTDVQVIVVFKEVSNPKPDRFKTGFVHTGLIYPMFFTGINEYDPLNYGIKKYGKLLPDNIYKEIWDLAYGSCKSTSY